MAKNCGICGEPVEMAPSATERAARYGGTPAYYTALFPNHADCEIKKRSEDTSALIQRLHARQGPNPLVCHSQTVLRETQRSLCLGDARLRKQ